MFGLSRNPSSLPATSAWVAAVGDVAPPIVHRLHQHLLTVRQFGRLTLAYRCGPAPALNVDTRSAGGTTVTLADPETAGCAVHLDTTRVILTAECDPFGAYRLYSAVTPSARWCSSDPRLLAGALDLRRLAPPALHGYLSFSYVPEPECIFAGVRTVPAGGAWSSVSETCRSREGESWIETPAGLTDEDTAIERLRSMLANAVTSRIRGEDRAGVFLSGGLDSSLIAALLVRAGVRVTAFTLDFGPPFNAEVACAEAVARHLGIPLRVVSAKPAAIRRALPSTAAALHQPFGDAVTVPLMLAGRAAAGEVGAVFNGEGGDQLFGGWANKPMIAASTYAGAAPDRIRAYLDTFHRFSGLTDRLYSPSMQHASADLDAASWIEEALHAPGGSSLLHALRAANLRLKGAQNIAPRAAQIANAAGLRLEMPFFDRKLAAWTFGLPPGWLLDGATEKHVLKRAAEPYLPAAIVWREKRGMGAPVSELCLGPLRRELRRWLSPRTLQQDGLFLPAAVAALRRGVDSEREIRRRRVGEKLWALLMFHVWKSLNEVHPL